MGSHLYYQVLDALSRPISDRKKVELYEYFDKELKPVLNKTDYKETYYSNNDTVTLNISPYALDDDQFANILGILMFSGT